MLNAAIKKTRALFIIFVVLLLLPSPVRAIGAVGSVSATEIVISYQHPGLTADSHFQGKKYRICVRPYNDVQTCKTTDNQSIGFNQLQVGRAYEIRVFCHCRGTGRFATAWTQTILSVEWVHSAPAPATPSRIVRLRSAQSGLCLYASPDRFLRSYACGPNPALSFAIEPAASGGTQIRHVNSGVCIFGSAPNTTAVRTAPCGTFGTVVWVMNNVNDTFRLHILATEDTIPGLGSSRGPGGCLRPAPVQLGQTTKGECTYGGNLVDVFYLDPA